MSRYCQEDETPRDFAERIVRGDGGWSSEVVASAIIACAIYDLTDVFDLEAEPPAAFLRDDDEPLPPERTESIG